MENRGFTLLELLVVIAIAALLVGLVVPRFSSALPGVQLKSDALRVAASLRAARGQAIYQNRQAVFVVDTAARQYQVAGLDAPEKIDETIEVKLVTGRDELISASRGLIRFFPDGSSTGGRVSLAAGDRQYHVDVDWLTGRVRIRE